MGKWSCSPEKCPFPATEPAPDAGIFRSSQGRRAFDVRMNLLTPNHIMQGYDKIADFLVDLEQAIRFYINVKVEESTSRYPGGVRNLKAEARSSAFEELESTSRNFSDLVISDGMHVFDVYGKDTVIATNAATGKFVANYTLPPPDKFSNSNYSKPSIRGMSLVADRLVLYTEGYGTRFDDESDNLVVWYGSTRVIVLDISKLPSCCITIVNQQDVRGGFLSARSIDNNIHLVTDSTIQFPSIDDSIDRSNPTFQGMDNIQYKKAAAKIVEPLIADAVTELKECHFRRRQGSQYSQDCHLANRCG